MSEDSKTYQEIIVRNIPIGVLIAVAALYVVYLLSWLAGFPGIIALVAILMLVHIIEFLFFLSYRIITGIKLIIESEVIANASGDNNSE